MIAVGLPLEMFYELGRVGDFGVDDRRFQKMRAARWQ